MVDIRRNPSVWWSETDEGGLGLTLSNPDWVGRPSRVFRGRCSPRSARIEVIRGSFGPQSLRTRPLWSLDGRGSRLGDSIFRVSVCIFRHGSRSRCRRGVFRSRASRCTARTRKAEGGRIRTGSNAVAQSQRGVRCDVFSARNLGYGAGGVQRHRRAGQSSSSGIPMW